MCNGQSHGLFVITERNHFGSFNHRYRLIIGVSAPDNLLPIRLSNKPGLLSSEQTSALLNQVAETARCSAASRGGSLEVSFPHRRQLPDVERVAVGLVLEYLGWERDSINLTRSEHHKDGFADRFRELRDYWQNR